MSLVKNYIEKVIFDKNGNSFIILSKLFLLLNRSKVTKINFTATKSLYHITDLEGGSINFTIPSRLKRFNQGVAYRLQKLANEYLIYNIQFEPRDLFIDVGANIGELSKYLSAKYDVKCICVEPEVKEFNCLTENLKEVNYQAFNIALWSEKTVLKFYQKNDSSDSSLFEVENYKNVVEMQTTTLDLLLGENSPTGLIKLIKLEAEGAEPEILLGSVQTLARTMYVSADIGPERGVDKASTLVEVNRLLTKAKFELIDYSHARGVVLYKNKTLVS